MTNIEVVINHLRVGNISQQHINLAIEALEKQVPKKVIRERAVSKECPVCRAIVTKQYCHDCGQKLEY